MIFLLRVRNRTNKTVQLERVFIGFNVLIGRFPRILAKNSYDLMTKSSLYYTSILLVDFMKLQSGLANSCHGHWHFCDVS
jgi:hypothetical protein